VALPETICEETDDHASCIVQQALEREDSIRTLLDNGAGNLDVVNLLISRGANMELEDNHGQTALTLAARQGHTKVVNCLIGCEANINHTDHDGWTALRSAAWGGHSEVVSALLYAGAKVDCADADGRTALRAAAWGGHEDIVLNLLHSPSESPDSTVDRQKSSLSNNSLKSSKNSSLRTTSST
uniref:Ankyrin repeat domain-containing protein 50-like n=1 Tax=Scophthalmus maximus TaxID=52904 RepID=A0A8D3DBS6_SCOMX